MHPTTGPAPESALTMQFLSAPLAAAWRATPGLDLISAFDAANGVASAAVPVGA